MADDPAGPPAAVIWQACDEIDGQRHSGIQEMSVAEIELILETAESLRRFLHGRSKKFPLCAAKR